MIAVDEIEIRLLSQYHWSVQGKSSEATGSIQIAWMNLDPPEDVVARLERMLSGEEKRKVLQLGSHLLRRRAVVRTARQRQALSRFCDVAPEKITMGTRPGGQPYAYCDGSAVELSTSHCGDLAVVAISIGGRVGVDVDAEKELPPWRDLVRWAATESEAREISALPPSKRMSACLRLWTRKEAYLKATGEGIGHGLTHVHVPLQESIWGLPYAPIAEGPSWMFHELKCPRPGIGAALVAEDSIECVHESLAQPLRD